MKSLDKIRKIFAKSKSILEHNFKVRRLGIFGSYLKGARNKKSDVDILVEFEQEGETFDNYMELKFFLEKMFKTKVDLILKDAVREEIKQDILDEVVYV
ncbi:MAG: nucleotidyltransferase family protein [Candidatus Omnitrophota bacterium]